MDWKIKGFLYLSYLVLQFISPSLGAFEDVPLESLNPEPEGVTVTSNSDRSLIEILENIPRVEGGPPLPLKIAKIKVSGPENVEITSVPPGPFSVELVDEERFITLTERLDFEGKDPRFFILLAQGSEQVNIEVVTLDENDNPVRIEKTEPSELDLNILEFEDVTEDPVLTVYAVDADPLDVGKLTFQLEALIGGEGNFRLDQDGNTGKLIITTELDYSLNTIHRLKIWVFDSDQTHSDAIIVTINVVDTPNLPPRFEVINQVIVDEETPVTDVILTVKAVDLDYGINWPIEYSMEEIPVREGGPYLTIDKDSGAISVLRKIDAEELFFITQNLIITVEVTAKENAPDDFEDPEELEAKTTIVINIRDINDNAPEICQTSDLDPNIECKATESVETTIQEETTGSLYNFIIRDLDSTLQFSKYTAKFSDDTPQIIKDALEIQPSRESSGATEYSIAIKDPSKLDFEEYDFSRPISFRVEITATGNTEQKAIVTVDLTVTDVNDNEPIFDLEEYEFNVCENLETGTILRRVVSADPDLPICDRNNGGTDELQISATDKDKTPDFGTDSIRYRWSRSSRAPPLEINAVTGKMTVISDPNFDYERFTEEVFIVEAFDNSGAENPADQKVASVVVKFMVLDVNDVPVDLKVPTGRPSIQENLVPGTLVWEDITATDNDLTSQIVFDLEINSLFKRSKTDPSGYVRINSILEGNSNNDTTKWFTIVEVEDGDTSIHHKSAKIVIGELMPDREGGGYQEIDRVDLIVIAEDENAAMQGTQKTTIPITIFITDENDELPFFEGEGTEITVALQETAEFPSDGDQSSETAREIYTFRAGDPDKDTDFTFDIDCPDSPEICDEMKSLVYLNPGPGVSTKTGKAILARVQGKKIDREQQMCCEKDTNELRYVVTVSDGVHEQRIPFIIEVEDINDNIPQWDKPYSDETYYVDEDETTSREIIKFHATDGDKSDEKFGIVNYILDENTNTDAFQLDVNTGSFMAVPGKYNWTAVSEYSITVVAIDFYRQEAPGSSSSLRNSTTVKIVVRDSNDNDPEFLTNPTGAFQPVNEDIETGETIPGAVLIRDIDDPSTGNAKFTPSIVAVYKNPDMTTPIDPMPFEVVEKSAEEGPNHKNAELRVASNLTGHWGVYSVVLRATDQGTPSRSSEQTYQVVILNVNFNAPEFEYPAIDNSTRLIISLESKPGPLIMWDGTVVPPVYATDKDDGSTGNGRVFYTIEPNEEDPDDGSSYFTVDRNNGRLFLERELDNPNAKAYTIYIVAQDEGDEPRSSTAIITFIVAPNFDRPPVFLPTETTMSIQMPETNEIGTEIEINEPYDPDKELEELLGPQIIYYYVVGGSTEFFEVGTRTGSETPVIRTKQEIDRETIDSHRLVIFVSNSDSPPTETTPPENVDPANLSFLLIDIEVLDVYDTPPAFVRTIVTGGISTSFEVGSVITEISVTDLDLEEDITLRITSDIVAHDPSLPTTNPFTLEKNSQFSAQLILQFVPQASTNGYYTFEVTATDLGLLETKIPCQIYIIKDSHVIVFTFLNRLTFMQENAEILAAILTDAFKHQCNIEKMSENVDSVNATDVRAHFIDLETNVPIPAVYISEQQYDPEVYGVLMPNLTANGFILAPNGIGDPPEDQEDDKLVVYLLVAGCGVLVVVLLVLATTCYFNNRSLSRRVRALTATTFGSQMSGLNRKTGTLGGDLDLPNSNQFAIEGSNPFWTTNPTEKKMPPAFDAESIGSGGSVLIGVEDDEDFKNYKTTNNPLFGNNNNNANNMDQDDLSDDDLYGVGDYNSPPPKYKVGSDPEDDQDAVVDNNFSFGGHDDGGDDYGDDNYEDGNFGDDVGYPGQNNDSEELTDLPMPTTMRRNPLMNMAFEDDE